MGGMTGGETHTNLTLEQPWDDVHETVRLFPPCMIPSAYHRGDPVTVFVKGNNGKWKRKRVGYMDFFPNGFIAWDDKNSEYAWHEVGTIDVPKAVDPDLKRRPVVRPDPTRTIQDPPPRARGSRKGWFTRWWTSLGNNDDELDFLRKGPDA